MVLNVNRLPSAQHKRAVAKDEQALALPERCQSAPGCSRSQLAQRQGSAQSRDTAGTYTELSYVEEIFHDSPFKKDLGNGRRSRRKDAFLQRSTSAPRLSSAPRWRPPVQHGSLSRDPPHRSASAPVQHGSLSRDPQPHRSASAPRWRGPPAQHGSLQLQRSASAPRWRPPAQQGPPAKDEVIFTAAPGGAAKHSGSQPQRVPPELPALQGFQEISRAGFQGRVTSKSRHQDQIRAFCEATDPSLRNPNTSGMSKTWPQGKGSKQAMEKRNKKSVQALKTIQSTAQAISEELDKTIGQLKGFQEGRWAKKTLIRAEDAGNEKDNLFNQSLQGPSSRRLSVNVDAANAGASLLNPDSQGAPHRQTSKTITLDVEAAREELEEDPGLDEERLKQAFLHFVEPGTFDLSIENLLDLLRYVGHPVVSSTQSAVRDIVREVTSYEYLDYDEFIGFMERYVEYEKENFREVFKTFDEDGSGELSTGELRRLIKEVGILGLNGMFSEAVRIVDVDGSGELDFDEFLKFLRIYQRNESFTAEEVREISDNMALIRSSEDVDPKAGEVIPATSLADVLVRFFGMHTGPDAQKMQQKIIDRHHLHNPHSRATYYLSLSDVLLYGRQIREKYYDDLKQACSPKGGRPKIVQPTSTPTSNLRMSLSIQNRASMNIDFSLYDADGDHKISEQELRTALRTMQYEPLSDVINEILTEVLPAEDPPEDGRQLDFDEFFDFLQLYRQREGFLQSELKAMRGIFHTFDEDGSGDVNALELGDVFRYMGFSLTVDELKRLVLVVDEDRSNELNFREFLRLMQLHRNSVIRQMREAFEMRVDLKTQLLPRSAVSKALVKLSGREPPKEVTSELPAESLDFEGFVRVADECHQHFVFQFRQKAGFTDTEIDNILELFRRFDKDGSGDIDTTELQRVFAAFGWSPKTAEEQQEVYGRLNRARALAREAGIEDVSEDGSDGVKEWEFVQLARMIRRQQETAHERHMAKLAQELRFSMPEVSEFHEVFLFWLKEEEQSDEEEEEGDAAKPDKALSRDIVRRLIRTMGVRFTTETKETLDRQLEVFAGDSVDIDFPAFLHLMRWILDTNFGGLVEKFEEKYKSADKSADSRKSASPG